ncbi:MAG: sulfite exporter TauE/SafE family protein [Stappiaceae bacterium]
MADLTAFLLPPDVSLSLVIFLLATSFVTSGISAAVGLGGGVTLIAILATVLPVSVVVPLHGVIQIGSNAGRAAVQLKHVSRPLLLWFALGAIIGAAAGGTIAIRLPEAVLKIGIALIILWMVWGRPPSFANLPKRVMALTGFVSTVLSMFFGATGPIVGAVLATQDLTRHQFVATQAATALLMHIMKVIAFGVLGFAFGPWLIFLFAMIAFGFLGTLAGSHLLGKMNEQVFRKIFRIVMTVLAVNILLQSLRTFFAV